MKVLIATKNEGKIQGAKCAFDKFFNNVEIEGVLVSSNVSEQPINAETWQGAINRVENLKKHAKDNGLEADYYVSIESGMVNTLGSWMIINIAVVEDKNGVKSVSSSPAFPVPEKYVEKIKKVGLGSLMDEIFDAKDFRSRGGGIQLLTHGVVTRINLTELAFEMALTKFVNGEIWK